MLLLEYCGECPCHTSDIYFSLRPNTRRNKSHGERPCHELTITDLHCDRLASYGANQWSYQWSSSICGESPYYTSKEIYQFYCDRIAATVPANRIEGFHRSIHARTGVFHCSHNIPMQGKAAKENDKTVRCREKLFGCKYFLKMWAFHLLPSYKMA